MSTAEQISDALGGHRSGEGYMCPCVAHDDKNPSLWVVDTADGGVAVHCHAGCSNKDVIEGLRDEGLWPREDRKSTSVHVERNLKRVEYVAGDQPFPDFDHLLGRQPISVHPYRTVGGQLIGFVTRLEDGNGKTYRPITRWREPAGAGVWLTRGFAEPRPLYRQERLRLSPDAPVLVVEGEKAVEAAEKLFSDYVVVTFPGGAASAGKADYSPLAGRRVVIWPDADEPGQMAAKTAAAEAMAAGSLSVAIVALPENLPQGWDLADVPPADLDVRALLDSATSFDILSRSLYAPPVS